MEDYVKIERIYENSFRVNVYTRLPFRMVGLIDVGIRYIYGIERVTLAFYRSSGTNSGKVEGLWYPIVGIKIYTGEFTEFTEYLNYVLTMTTKNGSADKGWLAKSLFFIGDDTDLRGFTHGKHRNKLLEIGKTLSAFYESGNYSIVKEMDNRYINSALILDKRLFKNSHTQRINYEQFIYDLYKRI